MKKNKRYLVIDKDSISYTIYGNKSNLIEVKCLEISPEGRVKLRFQSGHESWVDQNSYSIIEELPNERISKIHRKSNRTSKSS